MRTLLRGTEADTLELDGTLPATAVHVPAPLVLAEPAVRVSLLLFAMQGLGVRGLPWPRFDYHEALWRIAVTLDGEPSWFAVACDLDRLAIRALGRRIVRYPTRVARFGDTRWSVDVGATRIVAIATELGDDPPPIPARRTFVRDGDRVYEIPWQEIAAPARWTARVDVAVDTLSEPTFGGRATWAPAGLVHRGRTHLCGIARPVR